MGAEAVMALMESDESEPPCVVSLDGNQVRNILKKYIFENIRNIKSVFFSSGHSCTIDGVC